MDANDAQLGAILAALTAPDTARIKQAEDALKPVMKTGACVGLLMKQLALAPDAGVRQIAAVLLRKKIAKIWKKVKKAQKDAVKVGLLERLGAEPERAVRKSVAALASAVAKILVPKNQWPELLAFISRCATSQESPAHRELAHLLLLQLSETVATALASELAQLAQLFRAALQDAERPVAVMALRACCAFVSTLSTDDDAMLFLDLVPLMVGVARAAASQRDDLVLQQFFDCFSELAQTPVPVLAPHVQNVVPFLLDVMRCSDDDLERATRDGAAGVVGALAECKPKLLGKAGLVPAISHACVEIMVKADAAARAGGGAGALFVSTPLQRLRQEEKALEQAAKAAAGQILGGDDEDDELYEGPSSQELAQTTLDQVALHVPHKWSLEPTLGLALQCLAAADPSTRRAGAAAVGVVAEGFQDPLREDHLADVLAKLAGCARLATDAATRECLCFAYGQLAEHCQPEVVGHAAGVVPVVFEFLTDARAAVVGTSCYVLEMFCESMDASQLAGLLEPLMQRLLPLLDHRLLGIREMAAAAVGSAAIAASENFAPYLDATAPRLAAMTELPEERAWELRGRSLEALGHLALAVGAARFAPYKDGSLRAAAANLELDSTELAEYSYGFFANAAKVMRAEFAPLLPQLAPHLLDAASRKDGASFDFGGDEDEEEAGGFNAAFLDEEPDAEGDWEDEEGGGDDDDSLSGPAVVTVRTAMMNVKRAAIVALGNVAEYTEGHFAPHLDAALSCLRVLVDYFHHEIRERAAIALQQVAHAACLAHGGDARDLPYRRNGDDGNEKEPRAIRWTKDAEPAPLPPELAQYVQDCLGLLVRLLREDTAKSVVATACEALNELVQDVGPAALLPRLQPVLEATLQLATNAAPCQTLLGEDDEEEDEDGDHDNVLMDNVADLCGALAKVAGARLGGEAADALFRAFSRFAQPGRSASDRSMALGCFAELATELPAALAAERHFETLLPLFSSCCLDPHASVTRNAAFGLGALCTAAPARAAPHVAASLQALYPLVTKADSAPEERKQADQAAADNALAAMCRVCGGSLDTAPADQVLGLVLPRLPLQEDAGENATVVAFLAQLAAAQHAALATHAAAARTALAACLDQDKIDDRAAADQARGLLAGLGGAP